MFRYSNCLWRGGLVIHSGLECLNDAKHCRVSTSRKSSFSSSSKASSSSSNMLLLMGRKSRSLSELSRKRKVIYGRRPTFCISLERHAAIDFSSFSLCATTTRSSSKCSLFSLLLLFKNGRTFGFYFAKSIIFIHAILDWRACHLQKQQ